MCNIAEKRLLPRSASDGDILVWNQATHRWTTQANAGGGFDPTEDVDITGSWSFNKPIQLKIATGVIAAPGEGHLIYSSFQGYEDRKFSNGTSHRFDFTGITTSRSLVIPDLSGTVAVTSQLPVTSGLLKVDSPLDGTYQYLKDYAGTASPLQLSSTGVKAKYVANGFYYIETGTGLMWHGSSDETRFGFAAGTAMLSFVSTTIPYAIGTYGPSNLIFGTNNLEGMRLIYNAPGGGGNLAIGTTTATGRVTVRGDGTNPILSLENSVGANRYYVDNLGNQYLQSSIMGTPGAGKILGGANGSNYIELQSGGFSIKYVVSQPFLDYNSQIGFHMFSSSNNISTGGTGALIYGTTTFRPTAASTANPRGLWIDYTLNRNGQTVSGTATGIYVNGTETDATGMTHYLMDLNVNASSKFNVSNSGSTSIASAATYSYSSRSKISSPADGSLLLTDNAGSNFNFLIFGGTTSAYPMLKRNGTILETRLADDSGCSSFKVCSLFVVNHLIHTTNGRITFDADGQITLLNNAETGFDRLMFGGITAASPALKPFGSALKVVMADDTGLAKLYAAEYYSNDLSSGALATAKPVKFGDKTTQTEVAGFDRQFSMSVDGEVFFVPANTTQFTT